MATLVVNNYAGDVTVETPILITHAQFTRLMYKYMNPPQLQDSALLMRVYQIFTLTALKDTQENGEGKSTFETDIHKTDTTLLLTKLLSGETGQSMARDFKLTSTYL